MKVELTGSDLCEKKVYRFIDSPLHLKYVGKSHGWHSFERVTEPNIVWAEVLEVDLALIEEVK